eukprot:CAMPEP_0202910024 /NCGR_PEP_ID=MMETSP1392-20130828/50926_1 /ASSEMBLY_ACC=CAM_ASM_000868 /TAXON_ID=225041 /ORGANISM="Chlamydomonas chlamydogama, Strain SAG 11-48b" /LENGTH=412 /DNA_ID=CAMNT_0049599985 /DNA_START=172 /DNA_END=1406 /DNA_ORIENTATION=+
MPQNQSCSSSDLKVHVAQITGDVVEFKWLDQPDVIDQPGMKEYKAYLTTHQLIPVGAPATSNVPFFSLTNNAEVELDNAAVELHKMIMHATEYTLNNNDLFNKCGLPAKLWPVIRSSFKSAPSDCMIGRLDIALAENGIKMYEWNTNPGMLLECGTVQGIFAKYAGMGKIGKDAGERLFPQLVKAWQSLQVKGTLHLLHDDNEEEAFCAAYMKAAAEQAGIPCKVVRGLPNFSWTASGQIQDADGEAVHTVWKTWSWLTAVKQLAADENIDDVVSGSSRAYTPTPRLVDVMLHHSVRTVPPIWSLVLSSKALLPVLWQLYPNHPLLLRTAFSITPQLRASGYAAKPVFGRAGAGITLHAPAGTSEQQATSGAPDVPQSSGGGEGVAAPDTSQRIDGGDGGGGSSGGGGGGGG